MGNKVVGIIGGMGPYAGVDVAGKLITETMARNDQEHIPFMLASIPGDIGDRVAFLCGQNQENPGFAISNIIGRLTSEGAEVFGICCNTAHSPEIFDVIYSELKQRRQGVTLVNLIEEVAAFIADNYPYVQKVGLLATSGTCNSNVYKAPLKRHNIELVLPDEKIQANCIDRAIYHPQYGIKAMVQPVSNKARQLLFAACEHLKEKAVDAIILGCTELPLAFAENHIKNTVLIDSSKVLARALIREAAPSKLRPVNQ